jgi:mRNA-degrading endonuclease YafQ of YafQ-DinJ toxin-antitoxin module
MRRIERTNSFRRDFKREKRGQHRRELDTALTLAVSLLAEGKSLPEKCHDPLRVECRGLQLGGFFTVPRPSSPELLLRGGGL